MENSYLTSDLIKELNNIRIFERFVALTDSMGLWSWVENRAPPEPDILCSHIADGVVAFELVEMCDPLIAAAINDPSRKVHDNLVIVSGFSPIPKMLDKF